MAPGGQLTLLIPYSERSCNLRRQCAFPPGTRNLIKSENLVKKKGFLNPSGNLENIGFNYLQLFLLRWRKKPLVVAYTIG
jgi:hypothetical protein